MLVSIIPWNFKKRAIETTKGLIFMSICQNQVVSTVEMRWNRWTSLISCANSKMSRLKTWKYVSWIPLIITDGLVTFGLVGYSTFLVIGFGDGGLLRTVWIFVLTGLTGHCCHVTGAMVFSWLMDLIPLLLKALIFTLLRLPAILFVVLIDGLILHFISHFQSKIS